MNIIEGPDDNLRYTCICTSSLKRNSIRAHMKTIKHARKMIECMKESEDEKDLSIFKAIRESDWTSIDQLFYSVVDQSLDRRVINHVIHSCRLLHIPLHLRVDDRLLRTFTNEMSLLLLDNPDILCTIVASHTAIANAVKQFVENGHLHGLIWISNSRMYMGNFVPNIQVNVGGREMVLVENGLEEVDGIEHSVFQDNVFEDIDHECNICMDERSQLYRCCECKQTVCKSCYTRLPIKKCPYCRKVW